MSAPQAACTTRKTFKTKHSRMLLICRCMSPCKVSLRSRSNPTRAMSMLAACSTGSACERKSGCLDNQKTIDKSAALSAGLQKYEAQDDLTAQQF